MNHLFSFKRHPNHVILMILFYFNFYFKRTERMQLVYFFQLMIIFQTYWIIHTSFMTYEFMLNVDNWLYHTLTCHSIDEAIDRWRVTFFSYFFPFLNKQKKHAVPFVHHSKIYCSQTSEKKGPKTHTRNRIWTQTNQAHSKHRNIKKIEENKKLK